MAPAHQPRRRALALARVSVGWAGLEALGGLASGVAARSVALVAFGADSLLEMASALIVVRRIMSLDTDPSSTRASHHRSHRSLAVVFFALASYVVVTVIVALVRHQHAHENALGLIIAATSVLVMPWLAGRKRVAASTLEHDEPALARLVRADAAETMLCATLGVATLVGVVAALADWWWADPAVALVVVYFALREGLEAWHCD